MKKLLTVLLVALLTISMAACGEKTNGGDTDTKKKVAVLLPYIGDQSYFDTLNNGVVKANAEYGDQVEVTLIEADPKGSADKATWENAYAEVCEDGQYDLVISGNATYEGFLADACAKYPDQMFMNFDTSWSIETPANYYAVSYGLDDLGYVVGTLSAAITKTNRVGVVVGMDNQAMNQFIAGYCQVLASKNVEYAVVYPNSFTDTALGKEYTDRLIKDNNCDVIWQVAGGLGNGVIEACSNYDTVWCVGVDQDQYAQFAETNPTWAKTIITSALKNTDQALINAVQMVIDGSISSKMGKYEVLGIKENCVGLAENDYYLANVPEDVRKEIADTLSAVANGEVEVADTMTMTDYENQWPTIRDANRINK